ncbi:sulfatase-like hydrolase/transferase [Dokdonella sp.]|uniref:sulfatase-like hydrolase/transferase n=1 Tax=Dokdonella sp. TaxID=2291710 RepID=UPI003C5828B8
MKAIFESRLTRRCRPALRAMAILLLTISATACQRAPEHPNVVIITFDTTRADHLGTYGFSLARTPTVDRLAAEGVRFDNAEATAPITAVSHSSIMTGLLPPAHGVRDNGSYALSEDAITLAERFKQAGYETRAFVSAVVLSKRYGIDQGFDSYDDDLWSENEPRLFMIRDRPASETIDRTLDWYDTRSSEKSDRPFFLWVHLFDPHEPHAAPGWTTPLSASPYDAEIAFADRELGRLVDALRESGDLDNTIFVFTADHGESLGEHNEKTHAIFIYRSTTRVPLIVRYPPRFPKGKAYAGPVSNVDIAPTLLELAHLPGAEQTQGIDLTPLARGESAPMDRAQYSESKLSELGFGMAPLYAIRKNGFTFIRAPKPELYDLTADPGETKNLFTEPGYVGKADALDIELENLMQESAKLALTSQSNPMSQETMQMLQSLGYLQGESDRIDADGIDPKDGILLYNALEEARHEAQKHNWIQAEKLLRNILADNPRHFSARSVLALVEFKRGRLEEARDQYLTLLAQDPSQFRLYAMLGQIALAQGQLDEADRNNREALKMAPQFVEAMAQLGLAALVRGNEVQAQQWYEKALAIDDSFPTLYRRMADLQFDRGEYEQALSGYREAYRRNPKDFRSLLQAGSSARRADKPELARSLMDDAIALKPEAWLPRYNLACLLATLGQDDAALDALAEATKRGLRNSALLEIDTDWNSLRSSARFLQIQAGLQAAETTTSDTDSENRSPLD